MQVNQPSIAQLEQAAAGGNEIAMLQLGNQLLSRHPAGTAECEKGLALLRKAADGSQAPAARWTLGAFYLHNLSQPGSIRLAVEWLERAVESRVGLAIDRMANLCLRGVGIDYQPERALALLRQLAEAGYQHAAWETGYLTSTLDELLDAQASVTAFARACAIGNPLAYYSLGLRFAEGAGVKQDLPFARALLLHAADAGIGGAGELVTGDACGEEALTWSERLKQNHTASETLRQQLAGGFTVPDSRSPAVDRLEAHFAKIGHNSMTVSDSGRLELKTVNNHVLRAQPSDWHWHSQQPRVATASEFLSREERTHILRMVGEAMSAPEQYSGKGARGGAESRFFNGAGMLFGTLDSDAMVRCIERRVAASTEWDMAAVEPCSVINYKPGQEYRPHVDYFEADEIATNRKQMGDRGGQRVITFLMCLQAAERGGETTYPDVDISVTHATGAAMMHYNTLPDGNPDKLSLHHGMPVQAGEKWVLRTTLREHSRYQEDSG